VLSFMLLLQYLKQNDYAVSWLQMTSIFYICCIAAVLIPAGWQVNN